MTESSMSISLRVPVFSVTGIWLGVTAHLAAGGARPAWTTVILLAVAIAVAGTAFGRRELGPAALFAAVGAAQVVVHVLLAAGHPVMAAAHGPGAMTGAMTGAMIAAHVAATGATACWLWRGEVGLRAAARRAAARLRRWHRMAGPGSIPRWRAVRPAVVAAGWERPSRATVRAGRGPPVAGA